jgi:hypothetical protein
MSDIFSNLYLAISVQYYQNLNKSSEKLSNYIIDKLVNENQNKINTVINNLGNEKYLLNHMKFSPFYLDFKAERDIFYEIISNPSIIDEIKKDIFLEKGILKTFNEIREIDINHPNYNQFKEKIINVDEFKCIEKKNRNLKFMSESHI